jgi:Rad3-related DNA helicase
MLDKYTDLREKLKEFAKLAKQYDLLDKHACKIQRFLDVYDKDNWVFNMTPADGRSGRRLEFKPIDVAPFADDMVFKHGKHVVMMSATILDRDAFCTLLGIPREHVAFISIPSPFPVEHRPIMAFPIGKMSAKAIDDTLPKLAEAVKTILEQHKNEKGIIHCHTYKIANYLKKNVRSKRLLIHNSENREAMLNRHIKSTTPTVLLSPSMTEGIDLYDELGRFQVICKVPYPYLGDKLVKKRMHKWRWWYPLQTAKSIVQAVGRSVRSMDDHAVTYILDSDWDFFYGKNKVFFPQGFSDCLK